MSVAVDLSPRAIELLLVELLIADNDRRDGIAAKFVHEMAIPYEQRSPAYHLEWSRALDRYYDVLGRVLRAGTALAQRDAVVRVEAAAE